MMYTSLNKLIQHIQKIQDFVNRLNYQDAIFPKIHQNLEKIATNLQEGKLCFQIIGSNSNSVKALHTFFLNHKKLPDIYQFNINNDIRNQPIIEGSVFCLVIDYQTILTEKVKQTIQYLPYSQILKLLIIIDMPNLDKNTICDVATDIAEINSLINDKAPAVLLEVFSLVLYPFYSENQEVKANIKYRRELEKCTKFLETLAKDKVEDILIKPAITQITSHIAEIEDVLNNSKKKLQTSIEKEEIKIQGAIQGEPKKQFDLACKKVHEEIDTYFKYCREKVDSLKNTLTNPTDIRSMKNDIKVITDGLKKKVKKKNGYNHVKLVMNTTEDTHQIMINCCCVKLSKYAQDEWHKIYNQYCNGGLNKLIEKIQSLLYLSPELNQYYSITSPDQGLDIHQYFDASIKRPFEWENRYRSIHWLIFLIKDIRSQLMSIVGFILLFAASAKEYRFMIILALAPLIILSSIVGYQQTQTEKIEVEADKLRKEGCKYYQLISMDYVNNLIDLLNKRLHIEEQKLKKSVDTNKEKLLTCVNDLDISLKNYKKELEKLGADKRELEVLKKFRV